MRYSLKPESFVGDWKKKNYNVYVNDLADGGWKTSSRSYFNFDGAEGMENDGVGGGRVNRKNLITRF